MKGEPKMKNIILTLTVIFAVHLSATIIHVPDDQATIQEGINIAVDGDTVLVADGIYTGMLNKELTWDGTEKHIIVKSLNGYENCIIDCQNNGRAFYFYETYQDSTDIIEGFTISNGFIYNGNLGGGAICCYYASPTIKNNKILNNFADECSGGGILLIRSDSKILGNLIIGNSADYEGMPGGASGGGIKTMYGSPLIMDNIIMNNEVTCSDMESGAIGAGIWASSSSSPSEIQVKIINNLVVNNSASSSWGQTDGGGIFLYCYNGSSLVINNTIYGNSTSSGSALRCIGGRVINNIISNNYQTGLSVNGNSFPVEVKNNNVFSNGQDFENCPTGIGDTSWGFNINGTASDSCYNISEDPQFTSDSNNNYFLSQYDSGQNTQSSCVNAGYGVPNDFGLLEYSTRTDLFFDEGYVDIGFHYLGYEPQENDDETVLIQNYFLTNHPNPFNPSTEIRYRLSDVREIDTASIEIYNTKGQKVDRLPVTPSGVEGSVTWNADRFASGVYFYKLVADGKEAATKKMLLLK